MIAEKIYQALPNEFLNTIKRIQYYKNVKANKTMGFNMLVSGECNDWGPEEADNIIVWRSYIFAEVYIQMWTAFIGSTMKYGGFNRFERTIEWAMSRSSYWKTKRNSPNAPVNMWLYLFKKDDRQVGKNLHY